jgi:uncharacterized membrane protein YeaQ/YmgE (transglycosylase-associated protein family)
MTLILSLLLGALIGWVAFSLFRLNVQQGLRTSLVIGLVGGGVGMQLAKMMNAHPIPEGQLNVFALMIAAVSASACLALLNMFAARRGG